jgi:hypothetical protein
MLRLPQFLGGEEHMGENEIPVGFALTGYFLNQHIMQPQNKSLPDARQRLVMMVNNNQQRMPLPTAVGYK